MNDNNELNTELLTAESYGLAGMAIPNGQNHQTRSGANRMNDRSQRDPQPGRSPAPFDAWCFIEILMRRWRLLLLSGFLLAALAALGGLIVWKHTYTAVAQLLRYEPMGIDEFFKPPALTPDTFAGVLKAPELLQRVAAKSQPPVSAEVLAKSVFVKPDIDSDLVKVAVKGRNPQGAVNLANLYAAEAVGFMKDLQQRAASEVNRNYLSNQLAQMNQDVNALQDQFRILPHSGAVAGKLTQIGGTVSNLTQQLQMTPRTSIVTARLTEKLQIALEELSTLTRRYTEAHPLVQQQRAQIDALRTEISESATNTTLNNLSPAGLAGTGLGAAAGTGFDPDYDIIRNKLLALDGSRQLLADRQREAQALADNPPGNVRNFAPATIKGIIRDRRWLKIGMISLFGGVLGLVFASGGVLLVEILDDRLKTVDDIKRVTRLPVLGSLGDLHKQGPAARERWAFRTWTMLQGRLSPSSNHGLVCGITSSQMGEGRSTWINLLAEAASLTGFRVLTIATRPVADGPDEPEQLPDYKPEESTSLSAITASVLTSPSEVTDQLTGPNPQPMVHIPLPGWVWNLERRLQWQEALEQWRKIENVVILVELPPASTPEAVLLGQNLPNLIWLARSGSAGAAETRMQLETLRHARCRLVGAVLNHEPATPLKSRFPRWLGCMLLCLTLSLFSAHAQQTTNAPADEFNTPTTPAPAFAASTNASLLLVNPAQRGDWQKRLTLGPGDILSFSLYGQPELNSVDVFVGPDGRVGFLEAQNILAAGLTVDELRTNMDRELTKYRRAPRTMITPVNYKSKKYYMLGKVVERGVYTLDHPMTIIEAVARAHGLETGLSDRNTLDLADLQKSFLMRRGQRLPINFEKLFEQGDLSQNITLEPDDYLYFPAASLQEVYVLGEVNFPGVVPYTSDLTVVGALAARGGFNTRAYKTRVAVIRGSLNHPQTFIIDTPAILDARGQDFQLQNKDIVFVSSRPFIRVEELLDLAATAFIQSVTAEWTGKNIGPVFTRPIFTSP
ncbi:MAG: Polysaccharide export protein [Pedosphaera sp.]|nr:Polysaccharide export protein [Pedosphaera sp.]